MKCYNCGKEINKVETMPFCYAQINDCKCKEGLQVIVPSNMYSDWKDFKCPECHEYPLAREPIAVQTIMQVTLKVNENIDEIL